LERKVPGIKPTARAGESSVEQVRGMGFAIHRSRTIISAMILGRRVTAQDVAWLRREVFADGVVTREEADELFAVARADMNNAPEWKEFFVEMIVRHVVRQSEPAGVVGEERAAWLLTRVDECRSVEVLAALVNVLAEAASVPEWLLDAGKARLSSGWPSAGPALPAATTG
jgi:hypothetical protein